MVSRPTRCVLVVEDDTLISSFVAEALSDSGYAVRVATNGQEALRELPWGPDLILLDLGMPLLDGWGFRAEQRTNPETAGIPVILMSALDNLESHAELLDVQGVLPKPFTLDSLLDVVENTISSKTPNT